MKSSFKISSVGHVLLVLFIIGQTGCDSKADGVGTVQFTGFFAPVKRFECRFLQPVKIFIPWFPKCYPSIQTADAEEDSSSSSSSSSSSESESGEGVNPEGESESDLATEPESENEPESETEPEMENEPESEEGVQSAAEEEPEEEPNPDNEPESRTDAESENEPELDTQPDPDVEPESTTEPESENEPELNKEDQSAAEPESTTEPESDNEPESTTEPESDNAPESEEEAQSSAEPESPPELQNQPNSEEAPNPESEKNSETRELSQFTVVVPENDDLSVENEVCYEFPCTFEWLQDVTDSSDIVMKYGVTHSNKTFLESTADPPGLCEASRKPYNTWDNIVWKSISSVLAADAEGCPISAGSYDFEEPDGDQMGPYLEFTTDEPLPCHPFAIDFELSHKGSKPFVTGDLTYTHLDGSFECPEEDYD